MELNIRRLEESDWETLVYWWDTWPEWVAPPRDFLPDNGTGGFMVLDGNMPICAGFIWISVKSTTAHINFIVSNKNYRKKPQRNDALDF